MDQLRARVADRPPVFAQAYFITAYVTGADRTRSTRTVHRLRDHPPAELLVFLTAFGAWPRPGRWIGFTFFLFFLGTVQIFLAPPDEDPASGWVHGFHGLLRSSCRDGGVIAHRGMRDLGLRRASPAAGQDAAPPQSLP